MTPVADEEKIESYDIRNNLRNKDLEVIRTDPAHTVKLLIRCDTLTQIRSGLNVSHFSLTKLREDMTHTYMAGFDTVNELIM